MNLTKVTEITAPVVIKRNGKVRTIESVQSVKEKTGRKFTTYYYVKFADAEKAVAFGSGTKFEVIG